MKQNPLIFEFGFAEVIVLLHVIFFRIFISFPLNMSFTTVSENSTRPTLEELRKRTLSFIFEMGKLFKPHVIDQFLESRILFLIFQLASVITPRQWKYCKVAH